MGRDTTRAHGLMTATMRGCWALGYGAATSRHVMKR
jgi:hypothetical protein